MTDATNQRPEGDAGAPPPPGVDSPVPVDAADRAAAAGRARQVDAPTAQERDELVPITQLEQRAEDRAAARRARFGFGGAPAVPPAVANPGAGLPGHFVPAGLVPAVAETMPQRLVPASWQQPVGNPVVAQYAAPHQGSYPTPLPAPGFAQPGLAQPQYLQAGYPQAYPQASYFQAYPQAYPQVGYLQGYAQPVYPQHAFPPHGYPAPGYVPIAVQPPRIPWSPVQRRAAHLSSWVGQTVMALATHLLIAFVLIFGFSYILQAGGASITDPITDASADSLTAIIALWSSSDRIWVSALIALLVGGGLLTGGWLLQALWGKAAGLHSPHRSTWLAWLCTTATTGFVGSMLWPIALFTGIGVLIASTDTAFHFGTLWSVLFWELGLAVLCTGVIGWLYGRMFYSQSRPRISMESVAAAEADAEAQARAADEAELTEVRLRGEPGTRTGQGS